MPPRKSDPPRRADVSLAQFIYDGDEPEPEHLPLPSAPRTSLPLVAPKPAPTHEMDVDRLGDESELGAEKERKDSNQSGKDREREAVTIEDLSLPKSIITRLAKGVLPPNTQIQANAILAMTKSATVFISHLANAANEHTLNSNKKTIMPNDVFEALEDIEYPFLRERLEAEFKKFNETQTTKRNTYRRRVAAEKRAEKAKAAGGTTGAADPDTSMMSTATTTISETGSSAPRNKKQKPNAPDDSAMQLDADQTEEFHDASDAETEPDQEEDEEDENEAMEEKEDGDEDEDELHDALEERPARDDDDDDEAVDNGGDSD
ncbi:histone-fold-containing protein [Xylariomycetidae sp. FL2044]|nr:histone-fold-containing protein [Xylariomycetidae sp. FL2044]